MQKENKKQIVSRIIFVVLMMLIFNTVFSSVSQAANLTYTMTEKLPGFETETLSDLPTLLQSIYKFSIWVVGICALFMITIGGFTYMTSAGNTATAGTGKKMITDAIIGLVLVLTAALLFTVINPSITTVNLQVTPVGSGAPTGAAGTTPTTTTPATTTPAATTTTPAATTPATTAPVATSASAAAAAVIANGNVTLATSGDCSSATGAVSPSSSLTQAQNGQPATICNSTCLSSGTPCTGSVTVSSNLLNAINTVSGSSSLTVTSLTGGQHTTNSTHYRGTAADVVPSTSNSQWDVVVSQFVAAGCSSSQTFCDNNGVKVSCSQATHIHVTCS